MKTSPASESRARRRASSPQKQAHPHSVSIPEARRVGDSDPDRPFEEGAHDEIDPDLRHRLISETAFEMYASRGFVDGYDVEDWVNAEASVDHMLLNPQFERDAGGKKAS